MQNPQLTKTGVTSLNHEIQEAQEKHNSSYRENITQFIHQAIDDYYHPGMAAEEVKKIVTNVTKKAQEPSLYESVRFLIP
jgi:uncharacterized protein YeeX (DUF496 family)